MTHTNSRRAVPVPDDDPIEIAAASVIGRDHRRLDRPCQDAFAIRRRGDIAVAVVCDGCGSGAHSELGARLGANLFATALARELAAGADVREIAPWDAACVAVLAQLAELAPVLADDLATAVSEHLLFTLLAAAITPIGAAVLAIGDGVVIVDDELRVLDPGPDNAPPYLAYELLGRAPDRVLTPHCDARAIVLASDGAIPLLAHADQPLAGDRGRVLDLAAVASDDRVFKNRDALRRRLALASQDVVDVEWASGRMIRHAGLLADDTTVVALRRRG